MREHLSDDQISQWILGQATPEEEQHGRECPECSAGYNRFRERISTFRVAMQEWSEQEIVPRLEETPRALSRQRLLQVSLRWALVSAMAVILAGIPIYQRMSKPVSIIESATNSSETAGNAANEVAAVNDDVLLMESVNAHLSRPLPMPMERVMALLPNVVEQHGLPEAVERKEIR